MPWQRIMQTTPALRAIQVTNGLQLLAYARRLLASCYTGLLFGVQTLDRNLPKLACVEFTVFGSSENEKFCYSTTKISDSTRDWESRSLDTRKRESKSCVIGNHVLELSFVSQRNIFKRFSNWWKSIIRNWPGFAYRLQFQTLEDRSSKLRRNPDPPDLRTGGRRLSVGEYEDSLLGKMKETHSMHYSDCHVSNFIAQISLHSKVRLLGSAARQHRAL